MSQSPPRRSTASQELPGGLRGNPRFALLVLLLLPTLLGLALWQWSRAAEKELLLAQFELRQQQPAQPLALVIGQPREHLHHLPVRIDGKFLAQRDFLLDNRILRGAAGYELITPFRDRSGLVVFVNRGWIAAERTRDQLPQPTHPDQPLELLAQVYAPAQEAQSAMQAEAGWPSRIQAVDIAVMAASAGEKNFYPYLLRMRAGEPGAGQIDWPPLNMAPERHRAYALQWLLLAVALLVIFLIGGTNLPEWSGRRKRSAQRDD